MVKLRMARHGAKKAPFYRLVAMDERKRRDGRFMEQLGHYDPMRDPADIKVDLERVDFWLARGARLSETATKVVKQARLAESQAEAT